MEVHCFPAGARSAPCGSPPFPGEGRLPLLLGGTTPGLPSNAKDKRRKISTAFCTEPSPATHESLVFFCLYLSSGHRTPRIRFPTELRPEFSTSGEGVGDGNLQNFRLTLVHLLFKDLILLKAGSGAQPRPNLNDNLVSKVILVLKACGNGNCCGVPCGSFRRSLEAWFWTLWRKLPQRYFLVKRIWLCG